MDELKALREEMNRKIAAANHAGFYDGIADAALEEAYRMGQMSRQPEITALREFGETDAKTIAAYRLSEQAWLDRVQGWVRWFKKNVWWDTGSWCIGNYHPADYLLDQLTNKEASNESTESVAGEALERP